MIEVFRPRGRHRGHPAPILPRDNVSVSAIFGIGVLVMTWGVLLLIQQLFPR